MQVFGLNYQQDIKIGEHEIHLKNPPKKKEDILFYNNKAENAFWNREELVKDYPEIWYHFIPYKTLVDCDATLYNADNTELLQLNKEDSDIIRNLYKREIHRRVNGVHFRNGDDLEYLTGSNYYTLAWCKMFGNTKNGGYGLFYKYQRDVFYLMDYMWAEWCLGLDISKAKKTGITQIIDGGYCVDLATRKEEWMIGFMSRSEPVAIENNMKLFLYAFDNLPMSLKPKVGFKAPKGGNIEFAERGKLNSSKVNSKDVLDTRVFCVPTAEHSFDSHFMNIIRFDEFPKYWQDSKKEPKEIFRNNKAGAKDQDFYRGRIIISSYPPEEDDIGSKQAEEVYYNSKLSTKKYGKTESELICYHIPAYKSLKSCIDKYGNCDEKAAMEKIVQNRDRVKKDKKSYLAEVRQNPNDEREAFGTAGSSSCFNVPYLTDIIYDLEAEIRERAIPPWVEGNYVWENVLWEIGKKDKRPPGVFCPVRFVPLTEQEQLEGKKGTAIQFKDVISEDKNLPLRLGKDEQGNILPPEKFKHFLGCDPTQYADADDVDEPSMQAMHVINLHDDRLNTMHRQLVTKILMSEYNARQELAQASYEDVVKMIIYHGCLSAVEANSPLTYTRLKNEGLGNYLVVKHKDGYYCRWTTVLEDNEYKGIVRSRNATQNELMETIIELIKHYTFKGDDGESEYARTIKSLKLLQQLIKFDPLDTKKSDLVMSMGYALLAYIVYQSELSQIKDEMFDEVSIRAAFSALEA